ncbi:hypothetical protein MMC13_001509 [Lambiella insularis]|nr:hypothetical protein [Lambiella insularis]
MSNSDNTDAVAEVARLEQALQHARLKLRPPAPSTAPLSNPRSRPPPPPKPLLNLSNLPAAPLPPFPHALLLLADSALPLGSFAFSSGLESYLAHHKPLPPHTSPAASFQRFLRLSLASLAGLALPYLLASYRAPAALPRFDNDLDAATPCPVARRASVAQGRALLGVWERAFQHAGAEGPDGAASALAALAAALKASALRSGGLGVQGHFAPVWALVCRDMGVGREQAACLFLFNHAKAVVSAAVRAAVMGPYQAQGVLAGGWLRGEIEGAVRENWAVVVEEAGQGVPVMDLWVGRHELLYSRIFNS